MSIDRWMDKKAVVHIHSGILLSHKKECIWVSSNEVDEPRAYYAEWNKSEKEKQISCINTYIWNLERWYWWTWIFRADNTAYRQYICSNTDADIENRLTDTGCREEGEDEMNAESSMEAYTLPYVKQRANGDLLHDSGNSKWGSVIT